MSPQIRESKAIGALLGTFVGDALGMPVEGYDMDMIASAYGCVDSMLEARHGRGTYTDDTQMMIGLAESLVACDEFDGAETARRFLINYDSARGYGRVAMEAIYRLSQGVPWQKSGEKMVGGGSYWNGSAMRVAPIGIRFSQSREELIHAATDSARITHTHPLGIGGAVVQAMAVSLAYESEPELPLDVRSFLNSLKRCIQPEWDAFRHKLVHVQELLDREFDPHEAIRVLGNDFTCQGSVPISIFCFLRNPDSFQDAVVSAVNLGGDTDTIGAMTGALAGARLGYKAIPQHWVDTLENEKAGRDYVIRLGRDLYEATMQKAAQE